MRTGRADSLTNLMEKRNGPISKRPEREARARCCRLQPAKRVRIATGKYVTISADLAAKAALISAGDLTRPQVRELQAAEPRHVTGLLAGSPKPLAIAKPQKVRPRKTG